MTRHTQKYSVIERAYDYMVDAIHHYESKLDRKYTEKLTTMDKDQLDEEQQEVDFVSGLSVLVFIGSIIASLIVAATYNGAFWVWVLSATIFFVGFTLVMMVRCRSSVKLVRSEVARRDGSNRPMLR